MRTTTIVRTRYAPCADMPVNTNWRARAACREEDPELFFPISGSAVLQVKEAKAVCSRCPVMDTCLAWALEHGQDAGVWGGLSEDERWSMKRRAARRRIQAGKAGH